MAYFSFHSSFYLNQMIEFRLNEKRNFSEELRLRQQNGRPPKISAVHYFLIRDLTVELTQSHATFRKMRRLEPGLWDNYLSKLGSPRPENMIIYHWRELAKDGGTVDDFIALASFRQSGRNIILYLLAIVVLGVMGSSAQAWLSTLVADYLPSFMPVQLWVMVTLLILLTILYRLVKSSVTIRFPLSQLSRLWKAPWRAFRLVIQGKGR